MDFIKMLSKGMVGFLTGLAAVAVFGIVQAITDYKPVVCSETVTVNCTSQFISTAYYAIVPAVTGGLVAFANWLKHRNDAKPS